MTLPKIAPAEWEIVEVLWNAQPLSAAEVIEAVQQGSDWHPKTIRTLLERLVEKGVVSKEKRAGCFRYAPCVEREQCVREEGKSFLQRFFGGDVLPMVAHFLDEAEVSKEDLDKLRRMLNEKRRETDR
jgi:BlaI family penicillinase repressor